MDVFGYMQMVPLCERYIEKSIGHGEQNYEHASNPTIMFL